MNCLNHFLWRWLSETIIHCTQWLPLKTVRNQVRILQSSGRFWYLWLKIGYSVNDFASVECWELNERERERDLLNRFSIFSIQFCNTNGLATRRRLDQNMVKNQECNSYWSMWFFHFADSKSQIKVKFPPRRLPSLLIPSISFAVDTLESF